MAASTSDARINTGLPTHPKTVKLCRRLGDVAGWNLVQLFLFTASQRPDGDLAGLTNEDLEISSGWRGDAGKFVSTLVDLRWLDGDREGEYRMHDWAIHNPYAAAAPQRSERAKRGQLTRDFKDPELVERKLAEWRSEQKRKPPLSVQERGGSYLVEHLQDKKNHLQDGGSTQQDNVTPQSTSSPAPAPSPSPTPSPTPSPLELTSPNGEEGNVPAERIPPCPHKAILALWRELMPEFPQPQTWNSDEARYKHLAQRWREQPDRQNVESWRDLLVYIRESKFLMGETNGARGPFTSLSLDWIVKKSNFTKIIEGQYHR